MNIEPLKTLDVKNNIGLVPADKENKNKKRKNSLCGSSDKKGNCNIF